MYKGELISVAVALSWTVCALFCEVATKRLGALPTNMMRMILSLLMLSCVMWWFTGVPYPIGADATTWFWLSLSGLVGYVLGDFCLLNAYALIGSRHTQLFTTLAPLAAALFSWMLIGQKMSALAIVGMFVTLAGIATAIYRSDKSEDEPQRITLRGLLLGIGAGLGQGVGLVLSAKGLLHYGDLMASSGIVFRHGATPALLLPFAATAIRAVTGLLGFGIWTGVKGEYPQLLHGIRSWKTMCFVLAATITGPFVGVSLSLMATQYTSVGIAQTIMATIPVLIIFPTWLLFHQKVTWNEVVGAVISVVGVSLFFI